jgi:hypothetical protein
VVPAVRRGLLAGIPVGGAFLVDLEADLSAAGAISTGALLAGFVAFDAPGRTRFAWQVLTAPAIGAAAGLGALTFDPGWLAAVTMGVVASTAALSIAVSARLYVAALNCVLALLLAQGLAPSRDIAVDAMLLAVRARRSRRSSRWRPLPSIRRSTAPHGSRTCAAREARSVTTSATASWGSGTRAVHDSRHLPHPASLPRPRAVGVERRRRARDRHPARARARRRGHGGLGCPHAPARHRLGQAFDPE